jgi:hypothetical protein
MWTCIHSKCLNFILFSPFIVNLFFKFIIVVDWMWIFPKWVVKFLSVAYVQFKPSKSMVDYTKMLIKNGLQWKHITLYFKAHLIGPLLVEQPTLQLDEFCHKCELYFENTLYFWKQTAQKSSVYKFNKPSRNVIFDHI